MSKRILITSSAFYPEISPRSFRATELAKEFARQGHEVTVLTLPYGRETEEFCNQHGLRLKFIQHRILKPIPILGAGLISLFWRALNRLLLQMFEYPDVELMFKYKSAMEKEQGYDLLISFSVPYPVHWGAAWARTKDHRIASTWIADCGDPYMGNQSDSFKKPFYFKYVEKWMFRKTDFISIPIEAARPAYYEEFHPKIVVIPQGLNFAEFAPPQPVYKRNSIPSFAYAGSFIPGKRDPRKFIDFLLKLDQDFRFFIFSTTDMILKDQIARSGGRIIASSYLPRKDLIEKLSQMEFLVNIENSTIVQMPSKFIDYYLADRPILSLPTNDVDKERILQFLQGNYSNGFHVEDAEKFRIETVCTQFLRLLGTEGK